MGINWIKTAPRVRFVEYETVFNVFCPIKDKHSDCFWCKVDKGLSASLALEAAITSQRFFWCLVATNELNAWITPFFLIFQHCWPSHTNTDFNIYCLRRDVCFVRPLHCELDQTGRSGVNHPEKEAELDSLGWQHPPPPWQGLCLHREGQAMFVFWTKQASTFCTAFELSLK